MARFRYKAVAPTGQVVEGEVAALARAAAIEQLRQQHFLPVRVEEMPAAQPEPAEPAQPDGRIEPVLGAPIGHDDLGPDGRAEPPLIERFALAPAELRSLDDGPLAIPEPAAAQHVVHQHPAVRHAPAPELPPAEEPAAVPPPSPAWPEGARVAQEYDEPVELADPAGAVSMRAPAALDALPQDRPTVLLWDVDVPARPGAAEPPPAETGEPPAATPTAANDAFGELAAAGPAAGAATLAPAIAWEEEAQPSEAPAPETAAPREEPSPAAKPEPKKKSRRAALPARLLPVFTRELQVLLSAGLPVDRALKVVVESTVNDRVAAAADALLARVRGGALLSEAMDEMPEQFDAFLRTAVRAGEAGGGLSEVLDQVAQYQERGLRLMRTVQTALVYPAVLAFAAAFSVVLLLTYVVPQFEALFRQSAQVPPMATRAVIAASQFLRGYGWTVPLAALLVWLIARWRYADARRGARLHRRVLRLPILGSVIAGVSMERFARALGTLLANGVALPDALGLVANTVPNRALGAAAAAAVERVKQGEPLADALDEGRVVPRLAIQLIRVGEEAGRLTDMLARLAEVYAGDVDVATRRLTALIEPILILVIGVVVGGIVLSLLAAIAGLNTLAL